MGTLDVRISALTDYAACAHAIDAIERDHHNTIGGLKAWNSGRQTYLTKAAENKIAAIERRANSLETDED